MTDGPTSPKRSPGSLARNVLLVISAVLVVLGDILAFNQLATQSPTDAILPVLVFVIGGAGLLEALRRALRPGRDRWTAIFPGLAGIAALAVWRNQSAVGWSVVLTLVAAVGFGAVALDALRGSRADRSSPADERQMLGLLCLAETLILVYVAALAAADAGPTLFS